MHKVTKPTKAMFMRILSSQHPTEEYYGEFLYSRNRVEFNQKYLKWLTDYVEKRSLKISKL